MTYKKIMQYSSLALVSLSLIAVSTGGVMAQDDIFDEFDDEDLAAEEALNTVTDVIESESSLSTLGQAIEASSLQDTLDNPDATYTVFAPTDQAFDVLPQSAIDTLLDPANQDTLDDLLQYHVLGSEVPSSDVQEQSQMLPTLSNSDIDVGLVNGNVQITDEQGNQYQVVTADLEADNGIVHTIDGVLLNNQVSLSDESSDEGEDESVSTTKGEEEIEDTQESTTTKGGEEMETTQETTKGGEELQDTGLRVVLPVVLGIGFIAVATKLYRAI